MVAPFYNASLETPSQLGTFLDSLLSQWKPDVLAMQDGIGAGHVTLAQLGSYERVIQSSCQRAGVQFWVDEELFNGSALASTARISAQTDTAFAAGATHVIGYDLATVMLQAGGLDTLAKWQAARPVSTLHPIFHAQPSVFPPRYDLLGRLH